MDYFQDESFGRFVVRFRYSYNIYLFIKGDENNIICDKIRLGNAVYMFQVITY